MLLPLSGLAAAATIVWIALVSGPSTPSEAPRSYGFRVVQVESVEELSPLARQYAAALTGGASEAVTSGRRTRGGEAR